MAATQDKFREIVFQILFSRDLAIGPDEEIVKLVSKELTVSRKTVYDALERVKQIESRKEELDQKIASLLIDQTLERIETNVLRLSLYELLFDDEIPPKVAIAEGIRLVKKFGHHKAVPIINAILDRAFQEK